LPLYETPFNIFTNDLVEDKTSTAEDSGLVNNRADKAEREQSGPVSEHAQPIQIGDAVIQQNANSDTFTHIRSHRVWTRI